MFSFFPVKMAVWSPRLHLATWTVINLLCEFSHASEVKVRYSDLKLCEKDEQVCVTDFRGCGPRPPSSIQQTLNMSCYYQIAERLMACEWSEESDSHTESDVSLIFRSEDKIISCLGIFNPAAVLSITARIKNYAKGSEIWSQPYTVFLWDVVKPSQPELLVLGSTADSIDVSWRSSSDDRCQLRYRINDTDKWTQTPVSLPASKNQNLTYKIKDLLPFTVYRAAVACRAKSGIWSDWSSDVTARTLDRVPFRPPDVCYRLEKNNTEESFLLHLMWKDLDIRDAGGRILGYQVSYEPVKKQSPRDTFIQNVTGVTVLLVVKESNHSITVRAFNMAGYGPAAHLRIDTQRQNAVPSVRNLWVSTSFPANKGLLVQWENPTAPPSVPSVSHIAVQWRPETRLSTSRWTTVDGFTTSTVIQDVDPDESYLISVFPVYKQQCGSPRSLPVSLRQGVLMEVVKLIVVDVTKTKVTIVWTWQRKSGPIKVNGYRVMLRKDSETQTLSLWPDQQPQHTFFNLKPHTEYSLHLLADNVSRTIISVKTNFDEIPAVAAVTPLLLLAVTVSFMTILSRTVYKSYFFPPTPDPRGSTTGQWLMDPKHKTADVKVLDLKDFLVTDVLGEKSLIVAGPSAEDDLHEDTSLLPVSQLIIKLPVLTLETEFVVDAPAVTESLESYQPHRVESSHHQDTVFIPEASQVADAVLLHQKQEANSCFPQRDKDNNQVNFCEMLHQRETAVKSLFPEIMTDTNIHCVRPMSCEAEYIVNASVFEKTDVETVRRQTDCSYLICETDYIANICLTANTAEEDGTGSLSAEC